MLKIQHFFHKDTFTLSYLLYDEESLEAAIIDPVLDFDYASGRVKTHFIEQQVAELKRLKLTLRWILDTHAHADHISGAHYLKEMAGGTIAIGEGITQVQRHFMPLFDMEKRYPADGSQFDKLLKDGEKLSLGSRQIHVIATPGHTPDSVSYIIENNAFVGDTIFMPDSGSARCDFPGGDAKQLYNSIQKLFALGDETMLYMCHDYQPKGRELAYKVTVAQQKAENIQINETVNQAEYVEKRTKRDAELTYPRYILPSIQLNILAGALPEEESNGIAYIKLPLNKL